MCLCVKGRGRQREIVCVKERDGVFVSEREREMVSLCVKEIEIMRERERESQI